jgi:hypothetical protein
MVSILGARCRVVRPHILRAIQKGIKAADLYR